ELKDRHPSVIAEVRGEGLLLGLRVVTPNAELVDELRGERLLTAAAGDNVVRLLPPLTIGEPEIAEAMAMIDRACTRVARAHERSPGGGVEGGGPCPIFGIRSTGRPPSCGRSSSRAAP